MSITYCVSVDFTGMADTNELTVKAGDIVVASEPIDTGSSSWALVTLHDTSGYVPSQFLKEVVPPLSMPSPDVRIRRLSDPRLPGHLLSTMTLKETMGPFDTEGDQGDQDIVPTTALYNVDTAIAGVPIHLNAEFASLFANHDRGYQRAMHTQHEQHAALKGAADGFAERLEALRRESNSLSEKMMDMNEIIEGEKKRWKERLNKEAQAMY